MIPRLAAFASLLIFTAQATTTATHWIHDSDSPLNHYATEAYQQTMALWLLGIVTAGGWFVSLSRRRK